MSNVRTTAKLGYWLKANADDECFTLMPERVVAAQLDISVENLRHSLRQLRKAGALDFDLGQRGRGKVLTDRPVRLDPSSWYWRWLEQNLPLGK